MHRILGVTAALVFMALATASAQTAAEGTIRGYVTDEQRAVLPGVVVTATGRTVAGTFTATTDAEGYYRLLQLLPGEYVISAELQGFARFVQEGLIVRAGVNLSLNVALRIGAVTETVDVKVDPPLLETESAVQAVNISGDLTRRLPLSGTRDWADVMKLMPGAVGNDFSYFVHGAQHDSLVMLIDGVDLAPVSQSYNVLMQLSAEAFEDVQIKTGAVDAATPLGYGGIINVATQSGTNDLKGAAGFIYQPAGWIGNNTPVVSTVPRSSFVQPEFGVGGPLVEDRLWFFGSYRHWSRTSAIPRTQETLDLLRTLDPAFVDFKNTASSHVPFVKVSGRVQSAHQWQAFYQRDTRSETSNIDTYAAPFATSVYGGNGFGARVNSVWGQALTTRVTFSYNDKTQDLDVPDLSQPSRPVHGEVFRSGSTLVGAGALAYLGNGFTSTFILPNDKLTIGFDATWFKRGWRGSHELQAGAYLVPRLTYATDTEFVGSGVVLEELVLRNPLNAAAGTQLFHRVIHDRTAARTSDRSATDYAFYVQDAWRPSSRLTINAGVRVDFVNWTDHVFDVAVQDSLDVGPRLGAVLALTADRRNLLRASWSRMHDGLTGSYAPSVSGVNTVQVTHQYDLDLNGTFETELVTPAQTAVTRTRSVDPDYHQPFVNEAIVGYRRQLPLRIAVDASFVFREFRDRATLVEHNAVYDGVVFRGFRDEAFNQLYRVSNNEWNWPVYRGVELSVTQQSARVQLIANYSRQWRHIEGTWQPGDPAAFIKPDAFANDKGIGTTRPSPSSTIEANSLSGTHMAGNINSAGWQDHVARVGANWNAPWDLFVSTSYNYSSGYWSGPIVTRLTAADPRFGPATVMLSNGRVVANPLATVIRFAFPTRGEGQNRTPAQHRWNLRAGREFAFRGFRLEASIDVLNVTNLGRFSNWNFTGANQTYSPFYNRLIFRQAPRQATLGLRLIF